MGACAPIIVKDLGVTNKKRYAIYRCSVCGKENRAALYALEHSHSGLCRSCSASKRLTRHGKSKTKLFGVWQSMLQRCYNKGDKGYKNYGARGVTVCEEWRSDFKNFYDWAMEHGYREGLSIDKDKLSKEKGLKAPVYSPDTCRWVDRKEQAAYQRRAASEQLSKFAKQSWERTQYRNLDLDGIDEAIELFCSTKISIRKLSEATGFARQTLSKYIKEAAA